MVSTGGPCVGDTTHRHVGLRAVRIGGDPDVARPLTDRKVRPVFAIGPLERVASLNCVGFFRPVLHEAATAAVPARTLLWSLDLQPRLPLSHICVLTAEDILVEHSSKATGADCSVTGTALPFPLWRRNSGLLHSPRTGITKKGLLCFKPWIEKVCGPAHNYPANPASLAVRLADLR